MLAHLQTLGNLGNFSPFLVPNIGVGLETAAEERVGNQRLVATAPVDPLSCIHTCVRVYHMGLVPSGLLTLP